MIEEVNFEGFGPGKTAFFVEAVTDNKMRTLSEIKNMFERSGGHLGGQGSTAHLFDKKGEIKIFGKGGGVEEELLELIDLGAEDVEDLMEDDGILPTGRQVQKYLIYVEPKALSIMSNNIVQSGFKVEQLGVVMQPNLTVEIQDKELALKVVQFAQKLEDLDDVQKIYSNFDIEEGLIELSY